jgi:hypothetical protein
MGGESTEMVIYDSNSANVVEKSMSTTTVEDYLNTQEQELIIYPNPNHGIFSIKLPNEESELQKIIITDARGIIVYNNNDKNSVISEIQLPNPVAGIYIILIIF